MIVRRGIPSNDIAGAASSHQDRLAQTAICIHPTSIWRLDPHQHTMLGSRVSHAACMAVSAWLQIAVQQ